MNPSYCYRLFFLCCFLILSAYCNAQGSAPEIERQTELIDPAIVPWFYRPERVETEKPELLLDILDIDDGDVVADIGAGGGFFSLRASQRVGPAGKVLAVDVQPEMLEGLRRMIRKYGYTNIEPILGETDDPKLPPDSVDHVLIVISYHEFSHPAAMMRNIHLAMKPDAQMLIVEYKAEDPESRVNPLHRMSEAEIMTEITSMGFRRVRTIDIIPTQHVFIFKKAIN